MCILSDKKWSWQMEWVDWTECGFNEMSCWNIESAPVRLEHHALCDSTVEIDWPQRLVGPSFMPCMDIQMKQL